MSAAPDGPLKTVRREDSLRVLAIIPTGYCFGLQHITVALFRDLPPDVQAHFLVTRWCDGTMERLLTENHIQYSHSWLGMFSRKLDWENLRMSLHCLVKLPVLYLHFLRLLIRFRPHLIYTANHHEILLLLPLILGLRKKVVCHVHDPPPAIGFQKFAFALWRRAVGQFICISESVRDRLTLLGGRSGQGSCILHNGITVSELPLPRQRCAYFVQQFGWPNDAVIVGITGQMIPEKGQMDFVHAAVEALRRSANVRFVIGGKPNEPFYSQLVEAIRSLGLGSSVAFSGWQERAQDFFSAIDILVLASKHEEGFGLVAAEALERGVPVIATRSGGVTEIVIDGICGWVVEKGDTTTIAERIAQLSDDSELRTRMGLAGRERVKRLFNLKLQARQFEKLLREMADGPTRTGMKS